MKAKCNRAAFAKKVRAVKRQYKICPVEMRPLFKHLLKLAIHSAKAGYCQRAGRELAKAKKIATD